MVTIKPDWSKAPKWANWWAMDENGSSAFYKDKPTLAKDNWFWDTESDFSGCDVSPNWEESLQERPKPEGESKH